MKPVYLALLAATLSPSCRSLSTITTSVSAPLYHADGEGDGDGEPEGEPPTMGWPDYGSAAYLAAEMQAKAEQDARITSLAAEATFLDQLLAAEPGCAGLRLGGGTACDDATILMMKYPGKAFPPPELTAAQKQQFPDLAAAIDAAHDPSKSPLKQAAALGWALYKECARIVEGSQTTSIAVRMLAETAAVGLNLAIKGSDNAHRYGAITNVEITVTPVETATQTTSVNETLSEGGSTEATQSVEVEVPLGDAKTAYIFAGTAYVAKETQLEVTRQVSKFGPPRTAYQIVFHSVGPLSSSTYDPPSVQPLHEGFSLRESPSADVLQASSYRAALAKAERDAAVSASNQRSAARSRALYEARTAALRAHLAAYRDATQKLTTGNLSSAIEDVLLLEKRLYVLTEGGASVVIDSQNGPTLLPAVNFLFEIFPIQHERTLTRLETTRAALLDATSRRLAQQDAAKQALLTASTTIAQAPSTQALLALRASLEVARTAACPAIDVNTPLANFLFERNAAAGLVATFRAHLVTAAALVDLAAVEAYAEGLDTMVAAQDEALAAGALAATASVCGSFRPAFDALALALETRILAKVDADAAALSVAVASDLRAAAATVDAADRAAIARAEVAVAVREIDARRLSSRYVEAETAVAVAKAFVAANFTASHPAALVSELAATLATAEARVRADTDGAKLRPFVYARVKAMNQALKSARARAAKLPSDAQDRAIDYFRVLTITSGFNVLDACTQATHALQPSCWAIPMLPADAGRDALVAFDGRLAAFEAQLPMLSAILPK